MLQNTINNRLRNAKPTTEYWALCYQRKEQTAITPLRIGNTRVTHKHLLQRCEPELCETCKVPISVTHILVDCQKYATSRQKNNLPSELQEMLKNDPIQTNNIISNLKETNL